MFNKKAISPLIATVLIIGFTVALAAIVMTWGNNFVKTTQETTGRTVQKQIICTEDVRLDIKGITLLDDKINLKIENSGTKDIDRITVRFYGSDGTENVETASGLESLEIKTFEIGFNSTKIGTITKIDAFPIINYQGESVMCKNCIDEEIIEYFSSCLEILTKYSSSQSGNYTIKIGSGNPFVVYCDMETDGGGWTGIGHSNETRYFVKGFETQGSFVTTLVYNVPMPTIIDMLSSANEAKQYLFEECKGSVVEYGASSDYTWWVNRNGVAMTNGWPNHSPNCDINDYVWRSDGGNITDKEDLPITQVKVGDTGGAGEEAYITIGKLWIR